MSIKYNFLQRVSAKVSISTTCLIGHGLYSSYLPAVVVASGDTGAGRALEDMSHCKWISLPKSYTNVNNQGISNTLASYITQMPTASSAIKAGTFITKAYITAEVYNIYNYAFNSAPYLRELWVYPTTPPTIQASSIGDTHADGWKIYVPYSPDHSVLAAYKAATNWLNYADKIFELDANGNIPSE